MRNYMKNSVYLIGISIGVSACQPSASDLAFNQKMYRQQQDRQLGHTNGLSAVSSFSKKSDATCDGEEVKLAKASIALLSQQEREHYAFGSWSYLSQTQKRKWEVQFALAEAALKQKCLDLAEGIFREIINFYTGNSYIGIRERARVGLDDVRDARRNS